MDHFNLNKFIKGWVVGDFDPSIIRTKDFEVAVKKYQAGDREAKHVHKVAEEITIVVAGVFKMNGKTIKEGDIIRLKPGEPADFICIEAGYNVVIKTPSVAGDKYLV